MNTLPFTTSDVLHLLGYNIPDYNKHSIDIECPMCGGSRREKKLNFNLDRGVFRCNKCDYYGNSTTFYANQMSMTTKDAYYDIISRLGLNQIVSENEKKFTPAPQKENETYEEIEAAKIDTRNHTYMALLNELSLQKGHMENLLGRGFASDFIFNHYYKSFPKDKESLKALAVKLQQQGCELHGVPGFFKYYGQWTLSYSKNGIFVPYINFNNQIQGMQIRIDNELLEEGEQKYKWFSSRYKNDGCGSSTYVHYACDFGWDVNNKRFIPLCRNNTFVLTEGAMKGDLFFSLTGQSTLAIPGVKCLKLLSEELDNLKSIGVNKIIIAYDMDFLFNIHVIKGLAKIIGLLKEKELSYNILLWDCKMYEKSGSLYNQELIKEGNFNVFVLNKKNFTIDQDKEKQKALNLIREGIKELNITNLVFAFDKKEITQEDQRLIKAAEAYFKRKITPVYWKLNFKGIDDYYAYKIKGIK